MLYNNPTQTLFKCKKYKYIKIFLLRNKNNKIRTWTNLIYRTRYTVHNGENSSHQEIKINLNYLSLMKQLRSKSILSPEGDRTLVSYIQ